MGKQNPVQLDVRIFSNTTGLCWSTPTPHGSSCDPVDLCLCGSYEGSIQRLEVSVDRSIGRSGAQSIEIRVIGQRERVLTTFTRFFWSENRAGTHCPKPVKHTLQLHVYTHIARVGLAPLSRGLIGAGYFANGGGASGQNV